MLGSSTRCGPVSPTRSTGPPRDTSFRERPRSSPLAHAAARAVTHELGTFGLLARARDRRAVVDASRSADGWRPWLDQVRGLVGFIRHQCASKKPAISVSRSLATAISGAYTTSSAAQMIVPRL